jgi:tryptophan-rich sensory protein
MAKIKFPFKATTFRQFKKRYTIFSIFFGVLFIILFVIRGNILGLWQELPFKNNYQLLTILFIILYIVVSFYIYNIFKRNYSRKSN